ncbi:MAG TPA: hypothetical protein VK509_12350, partial [Polyangiales bacterium]|nr:hypothetical protein [Polyangiales bacterium]
MRARLSAARGAMRLLSALLLLPLGGCSYLFTSDGPRSRCSTSKAPPVIDTLIGGYQVVRTGFAVAAPDETYDGALISREADIGFGLGLSALFIASAYYGYDVTSDCARAHSPGPPPDESGDITASFRGRRV